MTGPRDIKAYVLDWHIDKSPAFVDCLVDPLHPFLSIDLEAWDGTTLPRGFAGDLAANGTCIFVQFPPPPSALEVAGARIIWVPMWDQAQGYSEEWWKALPRTLRVVAFSQAVATRAERAGLEVLRLTYYKDPSLLRPATWDQGPCLMYWNRTGLVGPEFLERLCFELQVKRLLFQSQCDPRVPTEFSYRLPSRLGATIVEELPDFLPREEYLRLTSQANVYCAPRSSEGIGMAFLEAMARGCGVLAYDGPTMNEYIAHGRNGYLLNKTPDTPTIVDRVMRRIRLSAQRSVVRKVSMHQDWARLKATNWQALGDAAREEHATGYQEWQRSVPRLAAFVEGGDNGLTW